jgi:proteasome accessory factor B
MLQIDYASLFENGTIQTVLHPYHLLYKNRAWYVIGFSQLHNSVRTFNLSRIEKISTMDRHFTEDTNFDVEEYIGRAWCLIPEGRLYDIKLLFAPMVAKNVAEVQWHHTQRAEWHDDGSVTLTFRVDGLNEISWWVSGYGDQVKIIAPAALRNKVLERAKRTLENHKNL